MQKRKIAVLGDGAWGTTLAVLLLNKGQEVVLWGAFPDYVETLRRGRENVKFLPGVAIPPGLEITSDLGQALAGAQIVVTAVPSHVMREVCAKVRAAAGGARALRVVNVSKGIERDTLLRMSQILSEVLGPETQVAVLSGPSHAEEVSRHIPTAVVAASADENFAREVQDVFSTNSFRVYFSLDVAGVEIGGATKNVVAIAAGICDGLDLGDNTKAAVITRGLHEMSRLGAALGASPVTFSGLSGLGDLVVTCMSRHSRNRWFGEEIGRGSSASQALARTEKIVEGYRTAFSVHQMAGKTGVEMPILQQVYEVLYEDKDPKKTIPMLMERKLKPEWTI